MLAIIGLGCQTCPVNLHVVNATTDAPLADVQAVYEGTTNSIFPSVNERSDQVLLGRTDAAGNLHLSGLPDYTQNNIRLTLLGFQTASIYWVENDGEYVIGSPENGADRIQQGTYKFEKTILIRLVPEAQEHSKKTTLIYKARQSDGRSCSQR